MLENLAKSQSKLVIYTMQDLLKQDENSRINQPNKIGYWTYRLPKNYLSNKKMKSLLKSLVQLRNEK